MRRMSRAHACSRRSALTILNYTCDLLALYCAAAWKDPPLSILFLGAPARSTLIDRSVVNCITMRKCEWWSCNQEVVGFKAKRFCSEACRLRAEKRRYVLRDRAARSAAKLIEGWRKEMN